MKKLNRYLENNINTIIIWYLFFGPIFDVITSIFLNVLNISFTLGIITKLMFIILLVYDLTFISNCRYKKKIIFYLSAILFYIILYVFNIFLNKDISVLLFECQNMLRTFYFPIIFLLLYNLFKEKRFNISKDQIAKILILYIFLILVPLITKIGFNSYAYSKTGSIGWFNSANEIGGILSILLPFLIMFIFSFKNKIVKFICLLIIIYTYFNVGTKVPVLSLLIVFGIYLFIYFIKLVKAKKWISISLITVSMLIVVMLSFIVIPKTSFYKNIIIHLDYLGIDNLDDLLVPENIDHFIYSERITFLEKTMDSYNDANASEKLLGIGYIENYSTDKVNTKMIEMDYYDIFFRHGIIGSIMYFIPLIYFLGLALKKITLNMSYLSLILILVLALYSGHILISPSVSILVSVILLHIGGINENSFYND